MKNILMRLGAASIAIGALLSMGGCASVITPVQPWEKGTLARPEMAFEGDKLQTRFNEHIYDSREAASGGAGVGGGGCGCN
jgi:uncharacterized protein YceK